MRIALLSYRSKPHCGGQGVYLRHLSRELVRLGHEVEVISGPPLPDLDEGVALTALPSLDLYREPDPFRTPRLREFGSWIDVLEWLAMCSGAFPEPLTFSLRARRELRGRAFDVVHDNQGLGYGLLALGGDAALVATVHHPVTVDRDLELASARPLRRIALRRWYGFTRMQARVARRIPHLTTVSQASREEIARAFGIPRERLRVIEVGVDPDVYTPPLDDARVAGRVVTVASSDVPLKGVEDLIEAFAKLATERDVELFVVGSLRPGGPADRALDRLGVRAAVRCVTDLSDAELAALLGSAQVAVVPSRYEGFSLPAVEAMATGTALVTTSAGALPEVTGPDGLAAVHVPPADPGALAAAIGRLLDDPALRARLGSAGRARVLERFTWRRTAERTAAWYAEAVASRC